MVLLETMLELVFETYEKNIAIREDRFFIDTVILFIPHIYLH